MPNIGALLKQEIARLSRREARALTKTTKKASAQYRRDIAALKREVETLKRQIALFQRNASRSAPAPATAGSNLRFVAKGLRSQRARLGLSAQDYGRLVGVSAQSVYNWEQGHAKPRQEQVKAIVALRSVGKRDAQARLKQMGSSRAKQGGTSRAKPMGKPRAKQMSKPSAKQAGERKKMSKPRAKQAGERKKRTTRKR